MRLSSTHVLAMHKLLININKETSTIENIEKLHTHQKGGSKQKRKW